MKAHRRLHPSSFPTPWLPTSLFSSTATPFLFSPASYRTWLHRGRQAETGIQTVYNHRPATSCCAKKPCSMLRSQTALHSIMAFSFHSLVLASIPSSFSTTNLPLSCPSVSHTWPPTVDGVACASPAAIFRFLCRLLFSPFFHCLRFRSRAPCPGYSQGSS